MRRGRGGHGRETAGVPRPAWGVLAVVFVATILMSLSGTMLTIALPAVVDDLDAGSVQATWILLGYMLVNTSLLIVMGQVADSVDRRRMFLAGLALYTAASLGLGSAPTAEVFLALRAVQGVAAAALLCNAVTILAAVFPRQLLNRAMGVYLAGFSVAQVAGPALGGLVTTWFGWRWLFWATVPIGLLALAGGWRLLRTVPPGPRRAGRVDVGGNTVVLVGLAALLLGLSSASREGWGDPVVVGGIAVFAVLFPVFLLVERRAARPAIDLALFRVRSFSLSLAAGFLLAMPRMSVVAVVGLYFQGVRGASPLAAALAVTPLAVGLTVGALVADGLTRWVEERRLVVGSAAVCVAGMGGLVWAVGAGGRTVPVLVCMGVIGLGNGVLHPLNSSMLLRSAPPERAGGVNAIRVMAQSGGMTLSTAVALTVVVGGVPAATADLFFAGRGGALGATQVAALTSGYVAALGVLTGILALGLVVAAVQLRTPGPATGQAPDPVARPAGAALVPSPAGRS
ncbi:MULTISPECIES: MFS transporter [unclassified Geodermatophilus]|uniref:MFS transporter n=1 Tax=unclassified Geodermatophilus TaxID=2637632 RepID=UPI003EE9AB59